jgi:hypothetical protein
VASLTDSNPNATAGQFTATITWGDGAPSTVGLVTANGRGGFDVSGAHTYAEEGNYAISVAINDGAGHSATANSKASIADAALHATAVPVIGTAAASTGAVTVATFTDDDPGGVVGDYSATIDWGDGSPATSGLIRTNLGGGFDVTSTGHAYVEEGSFTVSVTVRDVGGASATVAGNAQIIVAEAGHLAVAGQDVFGAGDRRRAQVQRSVRNAGGPGGRRVASAIIRDGHAERVDAFLRIGMTRAGDVEDAGRFRHDTARDDRRAVTPVDARAVAVSRAGRIIVRKRGDRDGAGRGALGAEDRYHAGVQRRVGNAGGALGARAAAAAIRDGHAEPVAAFRRVNMAGTQHIEAA